uniref:Uncharacterized protein n=1 Tax=Nelumbo nucifera TaxID=4432 RepID=A0A822ZEY5_NELNU|nr:TPA_asm: hypothetical protein HUJ06_001320 [Nelumbo nucifera]
MANVQNFPRQYDFSGWRQLERFISCTLRPMFMNAFLIIIITATLNGSIFSFYGDDYELMMSLNFCFGN